MGTYFISCCVFFTLVNCTCHCLPQLVIIEILKLLALNSYQTSKIFFVPVKSINCQKWSALTLPAWYRHQNITVGVSNAWDGNDDEAKWQPIWLKTMSLIRNPPKQYNTRTRLNFGILLASTKNVFLSEDDCYKKWKSLFIDNINAN